MSERSKTYLERSINSETKSEKVNTIIFGLFKQTLESLINPNDELQCPDETGDSEKSHSTSGDAEEKLVNRMHDLHIEDNAECSDF